MAYTFCSGGVLAALAKTSGELNFGKAKSPGQWLRGNTCCRRRCTCGTSRFPLPARRHDIHHTILMHSGGSVSDPVIRGVGSSDRGRPLRSARLAFDYRICRLPPIRDLGRSDRQEAPNVGAVQFKFSSVFAGELKFRMRRKKRNTQCPSRTRAERKPKDCSTCQTSSGEEGHHLAAASAPTGFAPGKQCFESHRPDFREGRTGTETPPTGQSSARRDRPHPDTDGV